MAPAVFTACTSRVSRVLGLVGSLCHLHRQCRVGEYEDDGLVSDAGLYGLALSALQRSQGSWASQRALEAQVAQLTQQLDLAAATNVELQKEIEVS